MKTKIALIGLILLVSSGCASGGKGSPTYSVYAWTAPTCPSTYDSTKEFALTAVFATFLIGTLIDTALNLAGSALTEAAKADQDGWAHSGENARYLYGVGGDKQKFKAIPAGCLIVAYARTPTPAKWCDGPNPIPAMATACTTGKPILETLNSNELKQADSFAIKLQQLKNAKVPPKFYAEIELVPTTDLRAVRPVVLQLHYPKPFQKRSSKTRNLVISADMKGMDGKSASVVMVTLKDIVPQQTIDDDDLLRAEVLWASMPAYNSTKPEPIVDLPKLSGYRVGPVNIIAEIRETGEINKFLQAFADAFKANTAAASTALKSDLSLGARQAAEVAGEEAAASLQNLQALALKARVDVLNACAKDVGVGDELFASDGIKNATIKQLQAAETAAKMTANATASKADMTPPYTKTTATSCPEKPT